MFFIDATTFGYARGNARASPEPKVVASASFCLNDSLKKKKTRHVHVSECGGFMFWHTKNVLSGRRKPLA